VRLHLIYHPIYHPVDWTDKLRNGLQVMALCLAISAIHYVMRPEKQYEVGLWYSVAIGMLNWALIDFGRHFFPSSHGTGWPQGPMRILLPIVGIATGFVAGTALVDAWFGWSSWHESNQSEQKVSLLITLVAGVMASFYFHTKYKGQHLETEVAQTQAQASHAKLKLLQTQLDPHLLFNTLANLRALITIDPNAALEMLDRMDAYLRATLSASRATEHPLADEFARLEDYLELMKVRMGERLQYTLTLPPELAHIAVPSLILQPLVENSIKHGLEPKIAGGEVNVSAQWLGGKLHLSVADTGVGMAAIASHPVNGQGFGMVQLRERLATRFGSDTTIECIANKPEGTCVNMVFSVTK
jgi:hypothetical protein